MYLLSELKNLTTSGVTICIFSEEKRTKRINIPAILTHIKWDEEKTISNIEPIFLQSILYWNGYKVRL